MLPDTPRCSKIVPDALRHFQILPDTPEYSQMLPDTSRYSQILLDTPRCSQTTNQTTKQPNNQPNKETSQQINKQRSNLLRRSGESWKRSGASWGRFWSFWAQTTVRGARNDFSGRSEAKTRAQKSKSRDSEWIRARKSVRRRRRRDSSVSGLKMRLGSKSQWQDPLSPKC